MPNNKELMTARLTVPYKSEFIPNYEDILEAIFSTYIDDDCHSETFIFDDIKTYLSDFLNYFKHTDSTTSTLIKEIPYTELLLFIHCEAIIFNKKVPKMSDFLDKLKEREINGVSLRPSKNSFYGINIRHEKVSAT